MINVDAKVMRVVRAVAREAIADGAEAVALLGSHARGDASPHSDVDVVVIGRESDDALRRQSSLLMSISWVTEAQCARDLRSPAFAGMYVPGWREALIIADPHGVAARTQRRAIAFRWDAIAAACDAWVADEITGYAEEVHKLVAAMEQKQAHASAVQRSVLALRLAKIMSVHHRILYGSENVLWNLVAEAMGAPWQRAQAAALSESGESLAESCRAALKLYALAAHEVSRLLDRRHRAVVDHACALAER